MADQLSCFNEAARICGEAEIQTIDDEREAPRQMRNAWLGTVAYCFEQSGWEIAEERAVLPRMSITPAFGYRYYYQIPAQCIRIHAVSWSGIEDDQPLDWKLEQGRIATNWETVYLRFGSSAKFTLIGAWPQTFADWVSAELASRVAPKLNPKALELAISLAKKRRSEARNLDAIQQPARRHVESSWARAARGRGLREGG